MSWEGERQRRRKKRVIKHFHQLEKHLADQILADPSSLGQLEEVAVVFGATPVRNSSFFSSNKVVFYGQGILKGEVSLYC
jgi:hypothetical protein